MTTIDDALHEILRNDPLGRHLGMEIEEIHAGYARCSMTVTADLLNFAGTAHGGAMMALIDVVHAAVSNSHGTLAVAQEVHTEFLAAGAEGDMLVCEGRELSRSKRTAVYRIDVVAIARDDRPTRLLATALARVFRVRTAWLSESGDTDRAPGAPGDPGSDVTGASGSR